MHARQNSPASSGTYCKPDDPGLIPESYMVGGKCYSLRKTKPGSMRCPSRRGERRRQAWQPEFKPWAPVERENQLHPVVFWSHIYHVACTCSVPSTCTQNKKCLIKREKREWKQKSHWIDQTSALNVQVKVLKSIPCLWNSCLNTVSCLGPAESWKCQGTCESPISSRQPPSSLLSCPFLWLWFVSPTGNYVL